ncbi:MAG: universal stress protein [Alphaproteobacteria bacterium]|jgi:nucleotide-binding universal stress UspA family protein
MNGYQSITVGIDFSPVCEAALFHAARIAGWSRTPLTAAHVVDAALVHKPVGAPHGGEAGLRDDFRRRLTSLADRRVPGAAIDFEVAIGHRTAGFLDIAGRHGSDLLVVGNPDDGRSGIGSLLRGCVKLSPADALIVRDTGHHAFRRIVVAVDLAPENVGVLERAARMAFHEGAELVVAFVEEQSVLDGLREMVGGDAGSQLDRGQRAVVRSRLAEMARPCLVGLPADRVSFHVAVDDDYPVRVSDLADALTADLLVIGYRRHGWLHDALTASTAEAVVEDSLFNVLVVKV